MTKKTKINKKSFGKNFKNYNLKLHGVRLPKFKIEPVFKEKIGLSADCENFEFLRGLCYEGFKKLNLEKGTELYDSYVNRVRYELDILKELGFTDYILLVWNVVNFCRVNDIPVGPGRGSAAGSIVLYLIDVTKLDPVRYDLFFERFVSKSRAKKKVVDGVTYLDGSLMCDVDLDICYDSRYKVIDFLRKEFKGRSSKISTLSTLSSKILIKDCGKIIGAKAEPEMNMVSSFIPKVFGNVADLQDSYDEVDEFRKWCNKNHRIFKTALKLRGLVRQKGVHAAR
jgi:DNA polymerase-3 subunit alpha